MIYDLLYWKLGQIIIDFRREESSETLWMNQDVMYILIEEMMKDLCFQN